MSDSKSTEAEQQHIQNRIHDSVLVINGCWEWQKRVATSGYGNMYHNKKTYLAHRLSFIAFKDEIPEDKEIDHLCHNRRCVNPEHLELVTHTVNQARRGATSRSRRRISRDHYKMLYTKLQSHPGFEKLPRREQQMFHMLSQGETMDQVGSYLSVSRARIQHMRGVAVARLGYKLRRDESIVDALESLVALNNQSKESRDE